MNLNTVYKPYYPAILVLAGAIIGIVAAFIACPYLSLFASGVAGIGVFWSAHRQIISSSENKLHIKKMHDLQSNIINHLTGGESFCYAYPIFNTGRPGFFEWGFNHEGRFAIHQVQVRICNLKEKPGLGNLGKNFELGTLFPGRMQTGSFWEKEETTGTFNLFFLALNGSWVQEIRWIKSERKFDVANRVVKQGMKKEEPLYCEISKDFPHELPKSKPWPS